MKVIESHKETVHELSERTKELECLYQISELLNQPDIKLDEMINKILFLIRSANKLPNLTSVMIKVKDKEYKTQNFKKTDWKISNKVIERENDISIEVYYMEDLPLVTEKIDLIEDVAFRLTNFFDRKDYAKRFELLNKTQIELEASERKFRFLYENAPLAYQSLDYRGNILDVNNAWLNFLGYDKEEVIGKWFGDFIDSEYLKVLNTRFPKFKEEGEVKGVEYEVIKKDGSKAIVSFNGKIGYDKNMNFERTHCIFQDITDRKRTEKKLLESEETLRILNKELEQRIRERTKDLYKSEKKYKELFNNMTSGVAIYNAVNDGEDFIFKDMNKAGEKISEVKKEEILEQKVSKMFPSVKDFGLFDVFKRVWKTGVPEHHPTSLYKDDKFSYWVDNYVYKLPTGEIIAIYDDVTEKKKAEQNLKESEEKYRLLVENAQEGIWAIDENGNTTFVNIKMGEILGYSVEEMIGRSLLFFMDEEGKKLANHYFERRKQGIKELHEFEFIKRNGERVYTRLETAPLINEKGEFYGALACVADVTDYHQAEEKLKQSEKKFKSIFIDSPIGIELYDSEGKLEDINTACLDIFGALDINSVKGFDLFQDPNVSEDVKMKLIAGETVRYESEFDFTKVKELTLYETSKSGIIDLDISITPLYQTGTNSISNYLVQIQDITERKRAEFDLKESEEKFRMTFEQAAVGIAHVAPDGRFLRVNQKWCNIVGYSPEEMITRTFQEITHPDDLDADLEFVRQMLDKEISTYSMEKRYFHKDRSIVWINLTVALLFEISGEPKYFISVIEDITDKKSTEEALQISEKKYAKLAQKLEIDLKETEFLAETLMERLPCIAILLRPHTREIIASNKYAKEVGAVPGKTCYGTWGQREDPCPWCLAPKALEMGKIQHLEVDALEVVWDAYWVPLKEDLYLHYAFDITEQRIVEKKLKKSEERYRNLYEEAPNAYFSIGIDGSIIGCNNMAEKLLGYTKEEILSMQVFDLYADNENGVAKAKELFQYFLRGENIQDEEIQMITKVGELKWISLSVRTILDETGNIIESISMVIDINERKIAEEEVRLHSEIMTNMSEGVYLIQLEDLIIVYANPRFEEMFGYDPGEMNGKNVEIVNAPTDKTPEETKNEIVRILKDTGEWQGEVLNVKKDGGIFWCYANVSLFDHPKYGTVIISVHTDITERKKAEEALKRREYDLGERVKELTCLYRTSNLTRETERSIENLVEESLKLIPAAWQFPDITCARISLNDKYYTTENFKETLWKQTATIKVRNQIVGLIEVYYLKEMPESNEGPFLREERDLINTLTAIIGNFIERKEVARNLKESEEKFSKAFHSIPTLMAITRMEDGYFIDVNETYTQTLGYSREELIGHTSLNLNLWVKPEQRKEFTKRLREDKRIEAFDVDVYTKSGKILTMLFSGDIIYLNNEPHLITIASDITERKKAEEELLIKNYALYYSINAIAIANLEGDLTYINPSFLKMWGYSDEKEVLGKKTTSFWMSEEKAYEVLSHLKNKRSWSGELIGKRKDGRLFDILLSSSIVMDESNNPICKMATFIDITERKRAEQLIIEENRKLKELSEMKRDIITRVSHELKTPLTSIHGASYYLLNYRKDDMNKEVLEYLEIIHRGGLRLKSLVDDLIDISRLESGKMELKKNLVDITEIIKDCLKDMEIFANHRNLYIKMDLQDEILIPVDKIRIGQVISNILSNAIKNTPPYGEISVMLNESIDEISIQVKDAGVGITEKERQSLFKKFGKIERYGKGMDVDTEGSGLGLFISKEIVELHNGSIDFESDGRNKGTTFTIILPKTK